MDYARLVSLIRDTDEKMMRVDEHDDAGMVEFPDTRDTWDDLLSDLMCRLVEELDIPLSDLANVWHTTDDCRWPILPEFDEE